ncbi:MAG: F0F1 ATP synthase subunit B [Chloroflexi bacterium HGW-Chloroflexi-2]|nr:MAG: F0F1 ATP synthase subunit B [Chloroflexi bacterium HGW-Chloroflexi-2]
MLIDWFTIIAQIFNFIVLVLLLRKFLYRPILKVMQEREDLIRNQLAEAEEKQQKAQEQISLYQKKNQNWEQEHQELLQEAKHEIENTHKKMMVKVRQEIEEHQTQWQQAIDREKKEFLDSLSKKISQQTFIAVRRVLNELADVELEAHISKVFIDRLRNMEQNQLEEYRAAVEKSDEAVLVRSAFNLPQQTREEIEAVAGKQFLNSKAVNFEVDPDLVCGIELRAAGYKLVWSLSEYLEQLEDIFEEGLPERISE